MDREKDIVYDESYEYYEYKVDEKRVFIVTPVYFPKTGKTIYDVLLSLMLKHEN